MIAIIGAMEEEVAEILKYIELENKSEYNGYLFYQGKMNNRDVVLMQSGIGKVNASISTTILFNHFNVDYVLNVGSAGGLNLKQEVGDIVISESVAHHDVDVTVFGREIGEVPGMPRYFKADPKLLALTQEIIKQNNYSSHTGLIVSGDQFISQKQQVEIIMKNFPQAMCSEMEAASVAQVSYVFNKKFIILRSLSDVFNKGDSSIQFDEYLKKASQASAKICYDVVSNL